MYPNKAEPRDLVDDGDDDILTSDQGNQQAADNQQAGFVYKSYNKRSTKQQQTQQKQANPQIAPKIEGLVNGETRQWGLANLNEPLLFPLKSSSEVANPAKSKLAAVMPRSASFVYTSTMPLSTSTDQTAYYEPASSSTFQAVAPRSYESWQPEPVSNGNRVADSGFDYPGQDAGTISSGYSYRSRKKPSLVFEEVFRYPSENSQPPQSTGPGTNAVEGYDRADYMSRGSATGQTFTSMKPSSPSNVRAKPFSQSWRGVPAFSKFFGGRKLKFNKMFPRPQNAVFSPPWVQVPSRVKVYQSVMAPSRGYQPIFHNPHPSRYIVRSRSSYQRGRYVQSKTRYTPDYPPNGMEGVERPAQS